MSGRGKKIKSLVNAQVAKDFRKIIPRVVASAKNSQRRGNGFTRRSRKGTAVRSTANPQLSTGQASRTFNNMASARNRILPGLVGSKDVANFEEIMLSLVSPALHKTHRWADKFNGMATATSNPWKVIQAPWIGTGTQTGLSMATSDLLLIGKRNAECNYILYNCNAAGTAWGYQFFGASSGAVGAFTNVAPSQTWAQNMNPLYAGGNVVLKTPYAVPTSAYQPHGKLWFAGRADGDILRRFFWIDAPVGGGLTTLTLVFANMAVGASCCLSIDAWQQDGSIVYDFAQGTAANAGSLTSTLTMLGGGSNYYSFNILCLTSATSGPAFVAGFVNLQLTLNATCSSYEHHCVPYYETNFGSTDGIRVEAMSMMYTNTAQEIYKNGEITCYQAPQDTYWTDFAGLASAGLTRLNASQGKVIMEAKEGMYQWLQFTQPSDFQFQTYVSTKDGVLYDSFWPLDNKSAYLVMYIQVPINTGSAGYFTIATGMEFQTTDPWREVDFASMTEVEWNLALNSCRNIPRTASNKLHLNDIGRALGAIAKSLTQGVLNYAPHAMRIANSVLPLFR